MMWSAERRRRNIFDSDDKTFDDNNPLFGWINGASRCGIALHVTPLRRGGRIRWYINSILASRRVQGLPEKDDTYVFGLCGNRCCQK